MDMLRETKSDHNLFKSGDYIISAEKFYGRLISQSVFQRVRPEEESTLGGGSVRMLIKQQYFNLFLTFLSDSASSPKFTVFNSS